MKLRQHRKHRKFVSSAVSLLLIFTMILSFSVYVFAETPDFTGTIPTEAEKNSLQENREYIPSEKEEISFTLHYKDDKYPEKEVKIYRYDGTNCLVTIDGKSISLVKRDLVVDLTEAVNAIVLK